MLFCRPGIPAKNNLLTLRSRAVILAMHSIAGRRFVPTEGSPFFVRFPALRYEYLP
jgi:hypothetical protein